MFKHTEELVKAYEDLFIYVYNNCRSQILRSSDTLIALQIHANDKLEALLDIASKENKTHVDCECVKKAILHIKKDLRENLFPDRTCHTIRQQMDMLERAVRSVVKNNTMEQIERAYQTKNPVHVLLTNPEAESILRELQVKIITQNYRLHIDESVYGALVTIYAFWEVKKDDSSSN